MKYLYEVKINCATKVGRYIKYRYRNVNIMMIVGKRGIGVSFLTNSYRDPETILTGNDSLVMDAVKKMCLIFALTNGKSLKIKNIQVYLNEKLLKSEQYDETHSLVYSMLKDEINIENAHLDDELLLTQLANTPKSNYGNQEVALMSFLVAISKDYRIEKFLYFWMSMNSIYSLGFKYAENNLRNKNGKVYTKSTEIDKLKLFAAVYHMEYPVIHHQEKEPLFRHAVAMAKRINIEQAMAELMKTVSGKRPLTEKRKSYKLEKGTVIELDQQALMFLWLPYQIRCHYFHGEEAIPLFCYENEALLQVISFANNLLEVFLKSEMIKWICKDQRKATMQKRVQQVASDMIFGM